MANIIDTIRNKTSVTAARETERLNKIVLNKASQRHAREFADHRLEEQGKQLLKEYQLIKQKANTSAEKDISDKCNLRDRLRPEDQVVPVLVQPVLKSDVISLALSTDFIELSEKKVSSHRFAEAEFNATANRSGAEVAVSARPEVIANARPEVAASAQPEVAMNAGPEVTASARPEVAMNAGPEVTASARPEVAASAQPEVAMNAGPEVTASVRPEVTASVRPEVTASARSDVAASARSDVSASARSDVAASAGSVVDHVLRREKRKKEESSVALQSVLLRAAEGSAVREQETAAKALQENPAKQAVISMPEGEIKTGTESVRQLSYPFKSWQGDPLVNISVRRNATLAEASDDRVGRALLDNQAGWQQDSPLTIVTQNGDQERRQPAHQPEDDENRDDE